MDPLSTAVAAIVAKYLAEGAGAFAKKVGEGAAEIARDLAAAVLDRLRGDPATAPTAEGLERPEAVDPEALAAEIEKLADADETFRAELQRLASEFERRGGTVVFGDVGAVQQGDHNVQVTNTTGNVTFNR